MCCDSWSHKELDMTERLNRLTELIVALLLVFLRSFILFSMGFDGSSVVKNPPAMQKMLVQYLSWERPLLTQKLEFGGKLLLLEMNGLNVRQE